ncbi:RNA polymerase sigma factor [Brevibacillus sp. TJ4]|uniref:RNA polymerase sigma factor n=1 Tax=Brevibacillus sp. TJ4 TaxID=3234853 RepID=UPI0037D7E046
MTDSQLIREIKEGNVECYAELIRRYERKILSFVTHLLRQSNLQHVAEDICQETFYKAYKSIHSFRDVEATFSTWLYTIARNTVLSELRKSRNSDVYLEDAQQMPMASVKSLPEAVLLRNERERMVRQAINSLPEKQRSALILREYEQLDYNEIAVILNLTVSSVKSLLFRARQSIKGQLETYIMDPHLDEAEGMNR